MAKIRLKSYHHVWLACHPGRTQAWLLDRLADGFHIHHVDGDHQNDSPRNLVMMEGLDHMLIMHDLKIASVFTTERGRALGIKRWEGISLKKRQKQGRKAGKASGVARRRRALIAAAQEIAI